MNYSKKIHFLIAVDLVIANSDKSWLNKLQEIKKGERYSKKN